jgi:hypothetical protein
VITTTHGFVTYSIPDLDQIVTTARGRVQIFIPDIRFRGAGPSTAEPPLDAQ